MSRLTRTPDLKALARRCKFLIAKELRGTGNDFELAEIAALRRILGEMLPIVEERNGQRQALTQDEVDVIFNDRGFGVYGLPLLTAYGHRISVYESSAASAPHMWLSLSPSDQVTSGADDDRAAHLNLNQAIALRDRVDAFIADFPEQ